jgi:SAM-dependent MidA family methyltransferase
MSICSDDHRAMASWLAPRIAQLQHVAGRSINILSVGAGTGRLDSLLLRSLPKPPARYHILFMSDYRI